VHWAGCRRDDDHILPLGQSIHQGQELGDDPLLHVADDLLALRRDGIDLIEEDDAGGIARGILEDLAEMGLALAVELVDDFRAVHRKEASVGFMGHGTGNQRLAAAWRSVQENPLGWVDPEPLEQFRIAQRELDDLANAVQLAFESADVLVSNRLRFLGLGGLSLGAAGRGSRDLQYGPGFDDHGAGRVCAGHLEVGRTVAKERGPNTVLGQYGKAVEEAADVLQIAIGRNITERREDHSLRLANRGLADIDELIDCGSGVFSGDPVDLDACLS